MAAYEELQHTHALEVAQLREAAVTHKVIGQAMGLLMSEFGLNEGAALEVLRRRSSHAHVEPRDLAQAMVEASNRSGAALRPVADC